MTTLYWIAKALKDKMVSRQYHLGFKRDANRILNSIESAKGKTNTKFIKLSDEYARDVLGWCGYAPWLYVYSAVAEKFKEGWIPDNYYGAVVVPAVQGAYGRVADLKPFTNKLFKK